MNETGLLNMLYVMMALMPRAVPLMVVLCLFSDLPFPILAGGKAMYLYCDNLSVSETLVSIIQQSSLIFMEI